MPTKYYKVHGGRVSFAEYWRMSPNVLVFGIAGVAKLFGGLPMNFSIPLLDELHRVDAEELPKPARQALKKPVEAFRDEGFELQFYHRLPLLESDRIGAAAILLARDGKTWASAAFAHDSNQTQVALSCISRFDDSKLRGVTTEKKQLKPHPDHVVIRRPGASVDEIHGNHLDHLADWERDNAVIKMTPESLAQQVLELERKTIQFHADRGVFVPMSKSEIRDLREASRASADEYE